MKLNLEQYKAFLEDLAKNKKVELEEIKKKMANCGPPGVTATGATGGVSSVSIKFLYLLLDHKRRKTVSFISWHHRIYKIFEVSYCRSFEK